MKKKYFSFIFLIALLLIICSAAAAADTELFVNDADSVLPERLQGVYAIGSGGTDLLLSGEHYALTGRGIRKLGIDDSSGGGGGLTIGHTPVPIRSERVRVGLNYSYSAARDSSVPSAVLENMDGGGFSLGYYDEYEDFVPLASSDESVLILRSGPDCAVDAYLSGGEEPFYTFEDTASTRYLVVRAEDADASTLIRYSGISYHGDFGFAVLAKDRLTVVNYVEMDDYLMGVCAVEMTESWPLEALKAQAVAARTYVQRLIGASTYAYACGFDVTADTYTQAYRGTRGVGSNIRQAVEETQNEYLTQNGILIESLYSAADGGATEDSENVFGNPSSYLIGVEDPYESAVDSINPYSEWTVTLTPTQLGAKLGIGPIRSVSTTTSRMGNVIKLEFVSTSGQTATLLRDSCRTQLGLNSIRYEISQNEFGNFVFRGSGCGHNLGMSQWGAYAMASYYGKDYRFILGYYYTDVTLCEGLLPEKPERPEPDPADPVTADPAGIDPEDPTYGTPDVSAPGYAKS